MKTVKMNKTKLLGIIFSNKEKHVKAYNEAVEDYKKLVVKISQENLKQAESGDLDNIAKIKSIPPRPVSYESSYNRALLMLELSVEDTIDLDVHDFDQLVQDEWQWKQSFIASTSTYKSFL